MKRVTFSRAVIVFTFGAAAFSSCSKSSSDAPASSSAISVSGTLSTTTTAAFSVSDMHPYAENGDSINNSLAVTDYTAVCATTTSPVLYGTGTVGADGKFSVSIVGGAGQPMSCFLVDSAGDKVADFLVEDTASKDLNGKSERTSTMTPSGNLDMDTVTFNPDTGEATFPKSNISTEISTTVASSVFDPTGAWTIGSVDFTLPSGVKALCTQAQEDAHTCNGPKDGMTIYMKMWTGTKTTGGDAVYGLQLWQSQASYNTCGGKVGLSTAQKTSIGVDFSANGAADAEFTFPSSVTFNDSIVGGTSSPTLTDNWIMSTAVTQYDLFPGCESVASVTLDSKVYTNAWRCGPDGNGRYNIGLGGGCTDSAGKKVQVSNWTGISCPGGPTTISAGIYSQNCSGNTTISGVSTAVTCTNKWAVVNSSNVPLAAVSFDYNSMTKIASGVLCTDATLNPYPMARLRCQADYYYRSGLSESRDNCMPRVNMDWSATSATDFIHKDFRPSGLVFFEQYKPFGDGSGGAMTTRQEHYDGAQVGGNEWVSCAVIDTGSLNLKKISDSKMLATYQSSVVTSSTAKPACLAKFSGKKETFVFYITK
jgi:hypothetical protein